MLPVANATTCHILSKADWRRLRDYGTFRPTGLRYQLLIVMRLFLAVRSHSGKLSYEFAGKLGSLLKSAFSVHAPHHAHVCTSATG